MEKKNQSRGKRGTKIKYMSVHWNNAASLVKDYGFSPNTAKEPKDRILDRYGRGARDKIMTKSTASNQNRGVKEHAAGQQRGGHAVQVSLQHMQDRMQTQPSHKLQDTMALTLSHPQQHTVKDEQTEAQMRRHTIQKLQRKQTESSRLFHASGHNNRQVRSSQRKTGDTVSQVN